MVNTVEPLRILIADDHQLVRNGIRALLQSRAGWEICGEARTGREAVVKAIELAPDIVILDISMPDLNGVDAAKRIQTASKKTQVLILSAHYSDELIREIVGAGVRGYVLKSDSDHDLVIAVETLAQHKPFFTARVRDVMKSEFATGLPTTNEIAAGNRITSREREIIQLLAEGNRGKEIASFLDISIKTVEAHRCNVMRKLDLHTLSDLVRYAMRNQIIEP
jgi:DNA-binding NarL/FixJ family response regulator